MKARVGELTEQRDLLSVVVGGLVEGVVVVDPEGVIVIANDAARPLIDREGRLVGVVVTYAKRDGGASPERRAFLGALTGTTAVSIETRQLIQAQRLPTVPGARGERPAPKPSATACAG